MALYAFNGTWNKDEPEPEMDTNVIKFVEIYNRSADPPLHEKPIDGVGTRYSMIGKIAGGITGAGGKKRVRQMYKQLCKNFKAGDEVIDVIGFSRGAALAVHFCNVIGELELEAKGGAKKKPEVRFLGIWDIVGSFGIPINFIVDFQKLDIGYDFALPKNARHVYHAMARDELRQTFRVIRLDPKHEHPHVEELWFRGVHCDIGGGNDNEKLSHIALKWMLERAIDSGLRINQDEVDALDEKIEDTAPIGENFDIIKNDPRKIWPNDRFHETAHGIELKPGKTATFTVDAPDLYSWTKIRVVEGGEYAFSFPRNQKWFDEKIKCGPNGWVPEGQDFNWFKEKFFKLMNNMKRHNEARWFEVIATVGESDDHMVRIGDGSKTETHPWVCPKDGELYAFANDARRYYDNNEGQMKVNIKRIR